MQNTKDTFYITLRSRLAAVNPARTMCCAPSRAPARWSTRTSAHGLHPRSTPSAAVDRLQADQRLAASSSR